jgi:hypothetical protein
LCRHRWCQLCRCALNRGDRGDHPHARLCLGGGADGQKISQGYLQSLLHRVDLDDLIHCLRPPVSCPPAPPLHVLWCMRRISGLCSFSALVSKLGSGYRLRPRRTGGAWPARTVSSLSSPRPRHHYLCILTGGRTLHSCRQQAVLQSKRFPSGESTLPPRGLRQPVHAMQ